MDIRPLTPAYAVSPQIDIADLASAKAAGFTLIIDNRPDGEIAQTLRGDVMAEAARSLGLEFVINPIIPGAMTAQNISLQAQAMAAAKGPVLAYCASGNRCSIVWALAMKGQLPTDELIAIPARFGYDLNHLRPHLD